jgi:hypothetical protein
MLERVEMGLKTTSSLKTKKAKKKKTEHVGIHLHVALAVV